MKKNIILGIGAGVVVCSFALVPFVFAETTGDRMEGTVESQLEIKNVMVPLPTSVSAEGSNRAEGGVSGSGSSVKSEIEVKISGGSKAPEVDEDETSEKDDNEDKDVDEMDDDADDDLFDNEIDIDVDDLMDDEEKAGHTHEGENDVDEADDVDSASDFEHFVSFKAKADNRIKEVEIKDGYLVITYALPVKFFGFWKTSLNTTAEVDSAGTVEVSYPWYSVFMSKDFSKKTLEPAFKASLLAHQHANANSAVQATTTASLNANVKTYAVPHVFDTVVKTFSQVTSSEISYAAKAGKTGKTK